MKTIDSETYWMAVYARPGQEKKAIAAFEKKKINCFSPFLDEGQRKLPGDNGIIPLQGLIFVENTDHFLSDLRQTPGVHHILYWLSQPAIFPAQEIALLRNCLADYDVIGAEKIAVHSDDQQNTWPHIAGYNKDSHFVLRLPSLGYMLLLQSKTQAGLSGALPRSGLLPKLF